MSTAMPSERELAYKDACERLRLIPDEVRTLREVEDYSEAIRTIADDDEGAHAAEDCLRAAVLAAISKGTCEDHPSDLAAAVLETKNIKFARWCA